MRNVQRFLAFAPALHAGSAHRAAKPPKVSKGPTLSARHVCGTQWGFVHISIAPLLPLNLYTAIHEVATRLQAQYKAIHRDELSKMGLDIEQHKFNAPLIRSRKERAKSSAESSAKLIPAQPNISATLEKEPAAVRTPATLVNKLKSKATAYQLPEDWLTAELPPEVIRTLTLDPKAQRRKARDRLFHPSPYDELSDEEKKSGL